MKGFLNFAFFHYIYYMRLVLFAFILLNFNSKIYCQSYVPMPMQNCYWQMMHWTWCFSQDNNPTTTNSQETYKLFPNGDTTIGTKTYVKFYAQIISSFSNINCPLSSAVVPGYYGAIRQDTIGKKIYLINPNQTSEKLLYNFNYVKGDSVKTILGTVWPTPMQGYDQFRIVDSVFYQSYSDGVCRKTFRMKPYSISGFVLNSYFTEGIGNEIGFENSVASNASGFPPQNSNSEGWGSFLVINNFTISAVTTNTCAQDVGLKENYFKSEMKIFPNPSHNEISISINNSSSSNFNTIIYDLLGNEILKSTEKKFKIDHLAIGTYIIKCFNSDTKEVVVKKFIKD